MERVSGTSQPFGKFRVRFTEAKCDKLLSVAQLSLGRKMNNVVRATII